ncbi:acyl-CoA-binding protein [Mucilaginibacter sp. E4BP6]|uniref:acyl-CoA-binding protein n=1 Tax=Mucilaginibacter sp. E4BP6 TaxID=2723089 RepID=UPI0015CB1137|nr:acyl-CoA-binding protein [Mucilaginibacter sp. E4BP6]NYE65552.1 acyl-CoA-binding protein [Mucilaginibacter sp. E4BP6]
MELKENFDKAVVESKQISSRPDNETLLQLYSLYKQATEGDINSDPPGMFDFVAKAKYDAWTKLKGTSADDAMHQYIAVVDGLKS